jgi:hypothetical protein
VANIPLTDLDYYDEVREIIGIDNTIITDDNIDRDTVRGQAERDIKAIVSDWSTVAGDDAKYLRVAVIYRICMLLCPRMSRLQPEEEVVGDYEYRLPKVDWADEQEKYKSLMWESLTSISTIDSTYTYPAPRLATPESITNIPDWGYI